MSNLNPKQFGPQDAVTPRSSRAAAWAQPFGYTDHHGNPQDEPSDSTGPADRRVSPSLIAVKSSTRWRDLRNPAHGITAGHHASGPLTAQDYPHIGFDHPSVHHGPADCVDDRCDALTNEHRAIQHNRGVASVQKQQRQERLSASVSKFKGVFG